MVDRYDEVLGFTSMALNTPATKRELQPPSDVQSRGLVKVLGPWKQIFYGEFDGRRRKRVLVKIIGE
jgi:hypothetical protein